MPKEKFQYEGIPTFAPEHFARVRQVDTMKRKQFVKGVEPVSYTHLTAFLIKCAAAFMGIVSDKRVTNCTDHMGNAGMLLFRTCLLYTSELTGKKCLKIHI